MLHQPIEISTARWCILRTAAPRTLLLAKSLAEAGFDVWTPTQMVKRQGRGRDRHKVQERVDPITPTFVFAKADRGLELAAITRSPLNPHPAFSVMRRLGYGIPEIRDAALQPLRAEEDRRRVRHLKTKRHAIEPGTRITMTEGAFAGMTGIVERGSGKAAVVNFGGGFAVEIPTYILEPNVVQDVNKPVMGIAA